jgi:hypothetical protein
LEEEVVLTFVEDQPIWVVHPIALR